MSQQASVNFEPRKPRHNKPFKKSSSFGGGSRSYGSKSRSYGSKSRFNDDNSSFGGSERSDSFGDRKPRSFGERSRSFEGKPRSFGDRSESFGDRKLRSFGTRRRFGHEGEIPFRDRSRSSRGPRTGNGGRSGRGDITMKPDFDLFIKKAKPVTIEEYTPNRSFVEHGLHETLIDALHSKNYKNPTPIQDQVIPHLLAGKDLIGIANTGTGKTAAFLLPLLHKTLENLDRKVLILAPTRELVMQIEDEIKGLTHNTQISSAIVVGGMPIYRQIENLRKPRQYIVGTTGRTLDLVRQKKINLASFDAIVLDEMDQMLDMGFLKDIHTILQGSKPNRHLLFFSATMDKTIEKVAFELLTDPVQVSAKIGQTTDNVEQDVIEYSEDDDKIEILADKLRAENVVKALVFENTKHSVKKIEERLSKMGIRVVSIHGNKTQSQRKRALDDFKKGKVNVLLATNVAARGLDIPEVSHVFNISLPQSREDYIHRIGRTGRAGNTGFAYTFVPKKAQRDRKRFDR
jgi:ATP-dependent RNA helicase RhlE